MATFPDEGRKNELSIIGGPGGTLLYVHLYTNPAVIDKNTTRADLLEAAWSSYTPFNSNAWSEPFIDTNGDAVILSPVLVFLGPTTLPGATCYGFFVTIGLGEDERLWMVEEFPTPKVIQLPNDQIPLRVEARLRYPPTL